jgi:hypothetical protein
MIKRYYPCGKTKCKKVDNMKELEKEKKIIAYQLNDYPVIIEEMPVKVLNHAKKEMSKKEPM